MSKADSSIYKERLLDLRARLRGEVSQLADSALRKSHVEGGSEQVSLGEIASDNYDQEFTLSIMENEGEVLGNIELALQRIEAGEFGTCEECSQKIPKARLNVLPYTPFCVKCAEKVEKEL